MRRGALAAVLVALSCCVAAATARADGDPASDYLLGSQVFLPFDAKIPKEKQQEIVSLLAATNKAGYKIRVAIIWSAYDLGAVTALWRKPDEYARFLGQELQFVYRQRLLIVMPNGMGVYWTGHATDKEAAIVDKVPIHGTAAIDLIDAGEVAVQRLAAAGGVHVTAPAASAKKSSNHTTLIVLLSTVGVAVLVLLRLALRRRR